MRTRNLEKQNAAESLIGAGLWASVATLAGLRRAPLGVIELLLLLAVLVIVPLGFNLMRMDDSVGHEHRMRALSWCEAAAALALVVSFWVRPGAVAAGLVVPWVVLGLCVALAGVWNLYRKEARSLADLAVSIAGVDLAFAGGWLVVSRAGLHPMGFQEPIVLLTAVHFHYSGFAIAVIASAALRMREDRANRLSMVTPIALLVLFLPFLLATGFVISPTLRMAAALGLALSVPALAACLFWMSRAFRAPVARGYVRVGAIAAWLAMCLAAVYAVTDCAGRAFMTMPAMASTHGGLNGLVFVLCSMLAFSIEGEARDKSSAKEDITQPLAEVVRKRPTGVRPVPEFVAREFYDR
jgi:hypothetical protein